MHCISTIITRLRGFTRLAILTRIATFKRLTCFDSFTRFERAHIPKRPCFHCFSSYWKIWQLFLTFLTILCLLSDTLPSAHRGRNRQTRLILVDVIAQLSFCDKTQEKWKTGPIESGFKPKYFSNGHKPTEKGWNDWWLPSQVRY